MDVNAIKHEDMLEVSLIEGEAKIENGYYTQEPSNEDSTATINHGLKLRNLHDITSRSNSVASNDPNADLASVATGTNISIEDWPGECEFKIDHKTLCLATEIKEKASDATYSSILDKLYCDMNKCFSIRFVLGNSIYPYENLSIRAMMVYTSPGDLAKPVLRCPNHMSPSDTVNQLANNPDQFEHVIWAHEYANYERNEASGRVSITTPFGIPHMGSTYVAHVYKFTCIGSCVGGINRRATAVVFSLEHQGRVIGRQSLSCRICSCPKRDKKSQENAYMKKSIQQNPDVQSPNNISYVPIKKKPKMMYHPQHNSILKQPSAIEQISGEQKRKEIITVLPPSTPNSHQIDSTSTPGMYMVPVRGYDNFLAVSKFAEYLDSVSGALQDTEYCMKRAKIMAKHSRQIELEQQLKEHPEDEDDSDSLVIDGVDSYLP